MSWRKASKEVAKSVATMPVFPGITWTGIGLLPWARLSWIWCDCSWACCCLICCICFHCCSWLYGGVAFGLVIVCQMRKLNFCKSYLEEESIGMDLFKSKEKYEQMHAMLSRLNRTKGTTNRNLANRHRPYWVTSSRFAVTCQILIISKYEKLNCQALMTMPPLLVTFDFLGAN